MPPVDADALAAVLERELGPGELTVAGEGGGYSNETLFLRWEDRDLVVRRPPADETADGAHDVLREYRVLDALQATAVPVPETLFASRDDETLGTDCYAMTEVEGRVLRTEEPDHYGPPERRALSTAFVDTLAAIHGVDYEAAGLGDYGRPAGYLERQVETFREACAWATEVTAERRAVPALAELGEWLAANVPAESAHALVHGDYKLDNLLFGPGGSPEVVAVFDWEMSTLGDPLADLAYALHCWPDPDESEADRVVADRFAPRFLAREGYLTRAELVARYEERTGRAFENRRFYLALAAYKMAALGEMFYARYLSGGLDDEMYRRMGEGVPDQARRGLAVVDGAWTV